ncbi:TetR family transcriptional regulator [Microlunatus endophyticus]|uniref:TetR family transcriptional regulator n=1 Tax=Microlunatus endophyticus TaxID=1716077 RepID=A0A917W5K8_9ACTN|nr:TetR/AcrR family transcriptional regulator [Microlunatus endophyticus]GGL71126.1 TetR family transcriptional regulator [Microlunatus endophyticus]
MRRRGAALENALLDAAWEELAEKGYDSFTIESVAARARTSRAVVYRRWPSKPDFVMAAIGHSGFRLRVEVADTGSLRGDMVEMLRSANRNRAPLGILMSARLGAFYAETGRSFADLRETYVAGRRTGIDELLDRAVRRGEADPARLTPRVRGVALDLYRHELLMTNRPVPDEVIESIVDEVFIPLVRPSGSSRQEPDRQEADPTDDSPTPGAG